MPTEQSSSEQQLTRMVSVDVVEAQLLPKSTADEVFASMDYVVDDFLFVDQRISMKVGQPAEIVWPWTVETNKIQFRQFQRTTKSTISKQAAVEKELRAKIEPKLKNLARRLI